MLAARSQRFARPLVGRLAAARSLCTPPSDGVRVEFDIPHVTHNIDMPPDFTYVTKTELLDMYELMFKMRRMEIAGDTLYKSKFVKGFCHLYDGQEAIVIGMEAATTFNDSLITSYRDHCQQLARGDTVEGVLSELLGKAQGCAKGKGGSMHMYKADANFFGGNGIVGAQVPVGAGLAFAHKYKGDGGVAMALYGDGAANQGQLYEAMNMAALWKLPLIYVCENNQYGMGTSKKRGSANSDYYTRGHYVPGIKVDGMNVLAVREAVKVAMHHAQTEGPVMMEMDTYRYHGHSMSDPGVTYRSRDEVAGVRTTRDPVALLKKWLVEYNCCTDEEVKAIEKAKRAEVDAAVAFAKAAPEPPLYEMTADIYSGMKVDPRMCNFGVAPPR
uniref:Pyruvate dehydrogenase E1 component subunit alpha n=1 Tax=Phaeocystis antarctica TaxID=33657 RepID=A0A7S0NGK6_9EUKA